MKIIVLSSELKQKHREEILQTAGRIGAQICFADSEDEIPRAYLDAEVLYGFGVKTAAKSPDLKWMCVPSAGVEYLLGPTAFANKDCILTNSSGSYGVGITEHIMMVTLMMLRNFTEVFKQSVAGKWGSRVPQRSLKGMRITVLGTGDIGSTFARRVKAFEPACITGVCRSGNCEEPAFDRVYQSSALDTVLPKTDLLILCLPATPETQGILSKERIEMLPEGAYIVNVGRGSAIDEDALAESLNRGKLAGAALDVFVTEPLPENSRLWKVKNLLISPHVAGNLTHDVSLDKNVEMFCEDLLRYAEGKPLAHVVDRKRGY
ncbi:MAG: D-2-hydroxyacid dehydrogenase [Lachnospiraceae bacterium]|nr:D-2-hydroxyacid dehydrogenase [Lachnospiraceae bacterium]